MERGEDYYTWDNFEIKWGSPDDYEIDEYIDKGKYSYVYSGICKRDKKKVVIKVLKPNEKEVTLKEVKIFEILKGYQHTIDLKECCKTSEEAQEEPLMCMVTHFKNLDFRFYLFNKFVQDPARVDPNRNKNVHVPATTCCRPLS